MSIGLRCVRSPEDASNPGNNLYVTGLSTRVTNSDLEKFCGKEGKVWTSFGIEVCTFSEEYDTYF